MRNCCGKTYDGDFLYRAMPETTEPSPEQLPSVSEFALETRPEPQKEPIYGAYILLALGVWLFV